MNPRSYFTTYQLKLPLELSTIIETSDPVYTFCEIIDQIDLNKYIARRRRNTGRPRFDPEILLKVILFAFMENGYCSTRELEKLCKTDIRFMWLLQDNPAPSHMTIDNFMNDCLTSSMEHIFYEITDTIVKENNVDLNHIYIDGTKIAANANKYSYVWKKGCITSRNKLYQKITEFLERINSQIIYQRIRLETREEYAIEYVEELLAQYAKICNLKPDTFLNCKGKHKTQEEKNYVVLNEYYEKLKKCAEHIRICGENRNSYSTIDHDATFMRVKKERLETGQLIPGYNIQLGICDEFIAVYDVKQFASDMDCFNPLMIRFNEHYGRYPEYPVADAGYGSMNNYLFCEEHGMKKYMKFTMFAKETKNTKFHNDPFRSANFTIDEEGHPICPNGKKFSFQCSTPIKGNLYGRTEEIWECEDCSGCPFKSECYKKEGNRRIKLNRELSAFHEEVINNLTSAQGGLLRLNRSIQAEGAYGSIKWNRSYVRARRRGLKGLFFEIALICCGFNLHKHHLKNTSKSQIA